MALGAIDKTDSDEIIPSIPQYTIPKCISASEVQCGQHREMSSVHTDDNFIGGWLQCILQCPDPRRLGGEMASVLGLLLWGSHWCRCQVYINRDHLQDLHKHLALLSRRNTNIHGEREG